MISTIEDAAQISEIIEMAWCDKTSFEDIHASTGLSEREVINIMRKSLKSSSFWTWRTHTRGRKTKHGQLYLKDHERDEDTLN